MKDKYFDWTILNYSQTKHYFKIIYFTHCFTSNKNIDVLFINTTRKLHFCYETFTLEAKNGGGGGGGGMGRRIDDHWILNFTYSLPFICFKNMVNFIRTM